jgi:hypothetical protein
VLLWSCNTKRNWTYQWEHVFHVRLCSPYWRKSSEMCPSVEPDSHRFNKRSHFVQRSKVLDRFQEPLHIMNQINTIRDIYFNDDILLQLSQFWTLSIVLQIITILDIIHGIAIITILDIIHRIAFITILDIIHRCGFHLKQHVSETVLSPFRFGSRCVGRD